MDAKRESEAGRAPNPVSIEREGDRELVVTRMFDAPAKLVFQAWTQPELFKRWWLPRSMGMKLDSCEMDVRTDGRYKLVFAGGFEFFGRYLEVVPAKRLAWTNEEGGESEQVTTVTFEEMDGRTRVVVHERFATQEAMETEGLGAAEATHETFGQLDELLVELRG